MKKEKDFEVTETMFARTIDSLFDKKEQDILASFFSADKKNGDKKCQSKR